MKKVALILLAVFCLIGAALAQGAMLEEDFMGDGLPRGWTVVQNLAGELEAGGGALSLICDTTAGSAVSGLVVGTPQFAAPRQKFALALEMEVPVEGAAGNKSLLYGSSPANSFFTIQAGGKLYPFGAAQGFDLPLKEAVTVRIAADLSAGTAALWCGEALLYQGGAPGWLKAADLSRMSLSFLNMNQAAGTKSIWKLKGLKAEPFGAYAVTSSPADGQQMADISAMGEIQVAFGAVLAPGLPEARLYSGPLDGALQQAEVMVSQRDGKLVLRPEGGLQGLRRYRAAFGQIRDLLGEIHPPFTIEFTTADAGYTAPEIRLEDLREQYWEGEAVEVRASGTAQRGAMKIQLLLNGRIQSETEAEGESFTFSTRLDSLAAGDYTLQLKAYDLAGGSGLSQEKRLTVLPNQPPTIRFAGIEDGGEISLEAPVRLEALDPEGMLELVEIMLDGSLYQTLRPEETEFSLAAAGVGKHLLAATAYDRYGKTAAAQIRVIAVKTVRSEYVRSDFEVYQSGTPSGFGAFTTDKGGYIQAVKIDGAHGTSAAICADGNTKENDIGPGIFVETGDTTAVVTMEGEVYFPTKDVTFLIRARKTETSNELKMIEFLKGGKINLLGSGGTITEEPPQYEADRWYSFRCVLDGASGKYDFYLDGKLLAAGRSGENAGGITGLNQFRLSINTTGGQGGLVALDNIGCFKAAALPYIKDVTPEETQLLKIRLSAPVLGEGLEKYITVQGPAGRVEPRAVWFDSAENAILYQAKTKLHAGMEYTVRLSGQLRVPGNTAIGYALEQSFRMPAAAFDVETAKYLPGGVFYAKLSNATDQERTAVAIVGVWAGEKLVRSAAKTVTVPAGGTAVVQTGALEIGPGEHAEAYLWDGLNSQNPISANRYIK